MNTVTFRYRAPPTRSPEPLPEPESETKPPPTEGANTSANEEHRPRPSVSDYVKTLVLGYLALWGTPANGVDAAPQDRAEPYLALIRSMPDADLIVGERHTGAYNQYLNALTIEAAGPVGFYREGATRTPSIAEQRNAEQMCEGVALQVGAGPTIEHDRMQCGQYFAGFVTPSDSPYHTRLVRSLATANIKARRFMLFHEASADDVGRALSDSFKVLLSMGHIHATGHVHEGDKVWDDPTGVITHLPASMKSTAQNETAAFRLYDRMLKRGPTVLVLGSTIWDELDDDIRREGKTLAPRAKAHAYFADRGFVVLEARIVPTGKERFNATVIAPPSYRSALLDVAAQFPKAIRVIHAGSATADTGREEL